MRQKIADKLETVVTEPEFILYVPCLSQHGTAVVVTVTIRVDGGGQERTSSMWTAAGLWSRLMSAVRWVSARREIITDRQWWNTIYVI